MKKILLADDDRILRDYVANGIPDGVEDEVDIAKTALEAIEMIRNNDYDRAIIDLRFEDESLDGFDILRIAEEEGVPERIIFTSVSSQMNLSKVGATAAFRKPLSIKKILKFVLTDDYEILREGEFF